MHRTSTRAQAILDALTQAADAASIGVNLSFVDQAGARLVYSNSKFEELEERSRGDGPGRPVDVAVSQIELEGQPASVPFVIDATHRDEAQVALARSEASFRALAESAPDGIVIARWPTIIYLNRAAAGMLGFESVTHAVGQNLLERLTPIEALLKAVDNPRLMKPFWLPELRKILRKLF